MPWVKTSIFTYKPLSENSADFTVPRKTDFREGFSTQQGK
jgi:hypothetical protein